MTLDEQIAAQESTLREARKASNTANAAASLASAKVVEEEARLNNLYIEKQAEAG